MGVALGILEIQAGSTVTLLLAPAQSLRLDRYQYLYLHLISRVQPLRLSIDQKTVGSILMTYGSGRVDWNGNYFGKTLSIRRTSTCKPINQHHPTTISSIGANSGKVLDITNASTTLVALLVQLIYTNSSGTISNGWPSVSGLV